MERLFLNRVQSAVVSLSDVHQFQSAYWPRSPSRKHASWKLHASKFKRVATQLHWLSIQYRINCKLAKFAFLARSLLNSSATHYLLRSQNMYLFAVSSSKTVFGWRACRIAALTILNSQLPQGIRSCDNISTFCRHLKDVLFL